MRVCRSTFAALVRRLIASRRLSMWALEWTTFSAHNFEQRHKVIGGLTPELLAPSTAGAWEGCNRNGKERHAVSNTTCESCAGAVVTSGAMPVPRLPLL